MKDIPSELCDVCSGSGMRLLPAAGQRLRQVRQAYGVRVKRMASALGVSESVVCD